MHIIWEHLDSVWLFRTKLYISLYSVLIFHELGQASKVSRDHISILGPSFIFVDISLPLAQKEVLRKCL